MRLGRDPAIIHHMQINKTLHFKIAHARYECLCLQREGVKRHLVLHSSLLILVGILFPGIDGTSQKWEPFSRLPSPITVREALSRYLDITNVPSPQLIKFLATMVRFAMFLHAEMLWNSPMQGHWKFLGGGGGILKAKLLEQKYESKLEIPGG